MAAYNWIIIEGHCPSCKQPAPIRCQTHIASSYDGDETGRFFDRVYRIGSRMAWWPEGHKDFDRWRENSEPGQPPNLAVEACYSKCGKCGIDLFAVIRFNDLKPIAVVEVGLESQWPEGYVR
jgi:hypothetical protein